MVWPPPLPPNTRTNATPLVDSHAADHNLIADALAGLVTSGVIASPFRGPGGFVLVPGVNGLSTLRWYRIAQRVFIDFSWNSGASGWNVGTATDEVRLTIPFPISAGYPTISGTIPRLGGLQCNLTTYTDVWGTLDLANLARFIIISGTSATVIQAGWLGKANGLISGAASYTTDAP